MYFQVIIACGHLGRGREVEITRYFQANNALEAWESAMVMPRAKKMEALEVKYDNKRAGELPTMDLILAELVNAEVSNYPVGLGQDLRFKGERYMAAGFFYEDNILHLAAFQNEQQARFEGRMARPSSRHRNY
jgi:hypothetical protein